MKKTLLATLGLVLAAANISAYTVKLHNKTKFPIKMHIDLSGCPNRSKTVDPRFTESRGVGGCCVKNVKFEIDEKRAREFGLDEDLKVLAQKRSGSKAETSDIVLGAVTLGLGSGMAVIKGGCRNHVFTATADQAGNITIQRNQ